MAVGNATKCEGQAETGFLEGQVGRSRLGGTQTGLGLGGAETGLGSDQAGDKGWLGILFILKLLREEERKERNQQ